MTGRQSDPQGPSGRFHNPVVLLELEVIEDTDDVGYQVLSRVAVVRWHDRGTTKTAHIWSKDPSRPAQKRNPGIPEETMASETVFEDYGYRLLPRPQEVVNVAMQTNARLCFDERQLSYSFCRRERAAALLAGST